MTEYRLPDEKFTEAKYLFQAINMSVKSDEEYVELCSSPTPPITEFGDLDLSEQDSSAFSWKAVKHRKPHRRYTVSHGAPPAPPSTPTSLSASGASTPSPTASNTAAAEDERPSSNLLCILDFAPKYKRKLKEQRGISTASRAIRKHSSTKIFKIHRNPKEFFRDPDEENSISAPECDTEDENLRFRRLTRRYSVSRKLLTWRQRRFAQFEHQERMDAMMDTFHAAMSINNDA